MELINFQNSTLYGSALQHSVYKTQNTYLFKSLKRTLNTDKSTYQYLREYFTM